jgi:hypothetical protein
LGQQNDQVVQRLFPAFGAAFGHIAMEPLLQMGYATPTRKIVLHLFVSRHPMATHSHFGTHDRKLGEQLKEMGADTGVHKGVVRIHIEYVSWMIMFIRPRQL